MDFETVQADANGGAFLEMRCPRKRLVVLIELDQQPVLIGDDRARPPQPRRSRFLTAAYRGQLTKWSLTIPAACMKA